MYAARDLEKHTMVIEYIGEVIRSELSELREKQYEAKVCIDFKVNYFRFSLIGTYRIVIFIPNRIVEFICSDWMRIALSMQHYRVD